MAVHDARVAHIGWSPLLVVVLSLGCEAPRSLPAEAYVWNRRWTPAVREAVTQRPQGLQGLRVLLGETGPAAAWVNPDVSALRGVRVVAVLRVGGPLPDDATWSDFVSRAVALRAAGVAVGQVEVDFDAPLEGLGAYVAWLTATRGALPFARSVTALPSWVDSPHLRALSASVDEVVLQVHTVRAPVLFEADAALRDVARWSEATNRPFRVALPAYRARLASGEELAARPTDVARVRQALAAQRLVSGLVFFRLGNADDRQAWSLATLDATLAARPLEARVVARLAPIDDAGGFDVWLDHEGEVDAQAPAAITIDGSLDTLLATTGYHREGSRFFTSHPPWLRRGEQLRLGTVRGKNLHVAR